MTPFTPKYDFNSIDKDSTQPSRVSSITYLIGVSSLGPRTETLPRPFVSKPTPTPNIEAFIKKENGLLGSEAKSSVDTKAQLFKAADKFFL